MFGSGKPYFGMTGTWLTVWVTVACATDMVRDSKADLQEAETKFDSRLSSDMIKEFLVSILFPFQV
jgi:hypothetical protein